MKPCKFHTIGEYWHSSSELCLFELGSDVDGLGWVAGYFKFCPHCGTKITKKIIKFQESK